MAGISRREFASLCGGVLAVSGLGTGWSTLAGAADTAGSTSQDELTSLTLVEASAKIHSKAVTPTQLTKAVLRGLRSTTRRSTPTSRS